MLLKAIEGSSGLIFTIAQRLKVSRQTVNNYLKKYPELNKELKEEKNNVLDFAESKLLKAVENGEAWAIKFLLLNQGQSRGYGDKNFKMLAVEEKFKEVIINYVCPDEKKDKED